MPRIRPAVDCAPDAAEIAHQIAVARAGVAAAGLDIPVVLDVDDQAIVLSVAGPGPREDRITRRLALWTGDKSISDAAVDLAVVHAITECRAEAIRNAGLSTDRAPAWAYVGNPVARALLVAGGVNLSRHTPAPGRTEIPERIEWYAAITGWRVGHTAMILCDGDISLDAANAMARIVIPGDYPATIVQALAGRPLREVVDLPWAFDSDGLWPIRKAWCESGRLGLTVECGLAPLADPPEGVDVSWLSTWMQRNWH